MLSSLDLPLIWAFLICTAIYFYVVLDGFDLGIGILYPFAKSRDERDAMMNTVAPVWDGNETWLILGGGGLFAVFPLAYSVLLTAFYMPLIIMLLALIFRGVAFEFRYRTVNSRHLWNASFIGGSFFAALCQGIMMGAFIQGVAVDGRSYAGGWFDWLTPFSLFTGLAVVAGYALLGVLWLNIKLEGELQARLNRLAVPLVVIVMLAIAIVSIWTLLINEAIATRWFGEGHFAKLAPLPILTALAALWLVVSIRQGKEVLPFVLALAVFLLAFIGFGISQYPYIIPREVTLWDAAGPRSSLLFLLVGASVLLPLIVSYTAWSYWVFRGKVKVGEGYH